MLFFQYHDRVPLRSKSNLIPLCSLLYSVFNAGKLSSPISWYGLVYALDRLLSCGAAVYFGEHEHTDRWLIVGQVMSKLRDMV
jgi:hypothetical protein